MLCGLVCTVAPVGICAPPVTHPQQWPAARSAGLIDPGTEARITELLRQMSLEEQVGQVIQTDIVNVALGQGAEIKVDAIPDHVYHGKVVEIGSSGYSKPTQPDVTFFKVKVLLSDPDQVRKAVDEAVQDPRVRGILLTLRSFSGGMASAASLRAVLASVRARGKELIVHLREQVAVVIVTHNLQQAYRIADRVAFMYLGELVELGAAEQVFGAPREARTKEYVSGGFG